MKNSLCLLLLLLCSPLLSPAQDPHFSQFYAAPLYLNPAFTGSTPSARVGTIARDQWPAIREASYITSSTFFDYFFADYNSGVGAILNVDRAGSIGPLTTSMALNYAYQLRLTERFTFRSGVSAGYTLVNMGSDLIFENPEPLTGMNNSYFDLGLGGLFYSQNFWIGYSAFHLNRPDQSIVSSAPRSPLPVNMSVHAGYKIPLFMPGSNRPGYNVFGKERSITPAAIYRRQGTFSSMQMGLYTTLEPIVAGVWYRAAPSTQTEDNSGSLRSDAVVALLGYTSDNLNIGYSYDLTLSQLGARSGGAHELSFRYQFQIGRQKPPRSVQEIPCPSF